jgi:hypothetical protein
MKFTALPVNVGDAFLLRSSYGTTLVDGGQNRKHIRTLLKQEALLNDHINLLVCTHYDADHVNGIRGVLESGDYTFDEVWLPEILGSLAYTISEDLFGVLRKLREIEDVETDESNFEQEMPSVPDSPPPSADDPPINVMSLAAVQELLSWRGGLEFFAFALVPVLPLPSRLQGNPPVPLQAMLANLAAAVSVTLSTLSSGAYVRWFRYSSSLTNQKCGFGMSALNSTEVALTRFSPDVFLRALYLTTINVESLVFRFETDQHPDILFCADSDFSFTTAPITLQDASVVTAPHHGSESCSSAYGLIQGSDLVYVRSDRSQTKRPGATFKKQLHRYCTICRNRGPKQKVEVEYAGLVPTVVGKKCSC